jgi:ATP-binding cassette subfamily B (MDR/TAP) protein 1
MLTLLVPQINSSRDTATRLLRLSSLPYHKSHESTGHLRISHVARIDFRDLSFTYPSRPDTTILQNLHLTIPPNTCTAIVGSSGSGKSTVASLILGLYPPSTPDMLTPSTLLIEGRDIRALHIPTLRSLVAVVAQQPTLFATSIAANITYGLPEGSPLNALSNIQAAAQAAGIDEFIESLPKGYQTRVGDGGFGLSGGQAQRLAIARALVRKPEVLILDEATSALDAESAEVVRESVRSLVTSIRGMTVIIITHSQEMMEMAEHIIVLKKGRVAEQGPFAELLKRGGEFRKLVSGGEWLGMVEEE